MRKIKSITLHKHDYILKDINSEAFELKGGVYNKTTYDDEGRTLSELKFLSDGSIEQHYEYTYNEQGAKTGEKAFDEYGELMDDMEYSIDAKGKILFAYKNYLDGSRDTITYRYDENGNLTEKELRSDEDEVEYLDKYTFDGDREILHESWDENNELVYRKETKYDEKGNILEEISWESESDDTVRVVNEYDDAGQMCGVSSLNGDGGLLFRIEYERNEQGHITFVKEKSPGREVSTEFEYDEQGNAILQVETNGDGEINSRIERSFDEDGNVVDSEAILDHHGRGMNQHYILKYEYEFY